MSCESPLEFDVEMFINNKGFRVKDIEGKEFCGYSCQLDYAECFFNS